MSDRGIAKTTFVDRAGGEIEVQAIDGVVHLSTASEKTVLSTREATQLCAALLRAVEAIQR